MTRANAVSPFSAETTDLPWTTWTKSQPVTALPEAPADGASHGTAETADALRVPDASASSPNTPPYIPRSRYTAVMNRMKNASRGATAFSAWST